jgi:flavorubredoxin
VGSERTLLVDTGDPRHWPAIKGQLDEALGGRSLDYVLPTHPEIPHAGNLAALLERFPSARVVGDIRDYHVHYPELADRLQPVAPGGTISLGDRDFEVLKAYVYDLHNTVWGLDRGARVMFVSDGFGYVHEVPEDSELDVDEPAHRPGDCRRMSAEMPVPTTVEQAAYGIGRALYWTRFVDVTTIFAEIERLLDAESVDFIAPAHGNVISDVDTMLRTSLMAHRQVYEAGRSGR